MNHDCSIRKFLFIFDYKEMFVYKYIWYIFYNNILYKYIIFIYIYLSIQFWYTNILLFRLIKNRMFTANIWIQNEEYFYTTENNHIYHDMSVYQMIYVVMVK